ncbi:9415_t:CDS:2 [Funneliformis geosporum]|uniref:9415_t:CDS:1 n=1 Tax=Funneliformis geosporum TaxID=1117311 RepID=A0A9W4SSL3_9GLOM|nr:9415_t:CDS:2 [Funneliformis geosporum]
MCGVDGTVTASYNTDLFGSFGDGFNDDFNSFGNNDNGSSGYFFNDISEDNKCIDFEFLSEEDGWDDPENMEDESKLYQKLKGLYIVWKIDNGLEKTKRGSYKIGKTPKSTYYDKYGLNGLFTKAANNTKKITSFL